MSVSSASATISQAVKYSAEEDPLSAPPGGASHKAADEHDDASDDLSSESSSHHSDEVRINSQASSVVLANGEDVTSVEDSEQPARQVPALDLEGVAASWCAYDVAFVHGICDDRESVWRDLTDSKELWPQRELRDLGVGSMNSLFFYYEVETKSSSTMPILETDGIDKLARLLLDEMENIREKTRNETRKRPLAFVSRDLGGLIVKRALCIARRSPLRYPGLAADTKSLVFYNCPHTVGSVGEAEDVAVRLLTMPGSRITKGLAYKARRLAEQIYAINNEFVDMNMSAQARTLNVVSSTSQEPDRNACFPLEEAQGVTTNPLEGQYRTLVPHSLLAHMSGEGNGDKSNDENTSEIRDQCNEFFKAMADENISDFDLHRLQMNSAEDSTFGRRILLSHCPPIRTIPMIRGISKDPFWSWFKNLDLYKTWARPDTRGTRFLRLRGDQGDMALLSERLILGHRSDRAQENWRNSCFYFRFRRHDCRFNNTRGMMISLLAQLASRIQPFAIRKVARVTSFLRQEHTICLTDIVHLFQDMWWLEDSEDFCWILSCINECIDEDLAQVFTAIRDTASLSEWRFRVMVTGTGSDATEKSLEGVDAVDICDFPERSVYERISGADVATQREELLLDCAPAFQRALPDALEALSHDSQLQLMILAWLKSRKKTPSCVQASLRVLRECAARASSATGVFDILGKQVPSEWQTLRDQAVKLVRHVLHPLTVQELASALVTDEVLVSSDEERDVAGWSTREMAQLLQEVIFPGQFVVKDNELHFAHDCLMHSLTTHTSLSISHAEIVRLALRHLRLPSSLAEMQDLVKELEDVEDTAVPSRETWTAYAVRYFPEHYQLAGNDTQLSAEINQFLEERTTMLAWSEAYYALSSPLTRIHRGYSTVLPILGRTGLFGLVEEHLRNGMQSQVQSHAYGAERFSADCWLAMVEASRHGNKSLVRLLMATSKPSAAYMREAIDAAAANGDGDLIEYLIREASNMDDFRDWPEGDKWADDILFRVVWLGHVGAVQLLIDLKVNVNPRQEDLRLEGPPLYVSIRRGHKAITKLLLDAGADKTVTSPMGYTSALNEAARWGDPETIQLLLDAGETIPSAEGCYHNPLQMAGEYANFRAIEALLKAGASPETRWTDWTNPNETSLIFATNRGYIECVRALVEHGANVQAAEGADMSPLQQAVERDFIEIAKMLLMKGCEPNHTTKDIELAVVHAVLQDSVAMLKLLLDHGADIEGESKTDNHPKTALASAAAYSTREVFDYLRTRGADVNHGGERSRPPLLASVWRGDVDIDLVKSLIQDGADVNARAENPRGWRPIHAAYDNVTALNALLDAGADINSRSDSASTVLLLASRWNFRDVVEALVDYKGKEKLDLECEFTSEDDEPHLDGMTPLCFACRNGRVDIMRLLLEAGANATHRTRSGSFPLLLCFGLDVDGKTREMAEDAVRSILEYLSPSELNQRDNDGNTVLHHIGPWHTVSVVRCLVNIGLDPSARNDNDYSHLMKAVDAGHRDAASYLISKGADIHLGSPRLGSPLRMACRNADLPLVRLLVEAGADVNELDQRSGESILQACMVDRHGSQAVIKYLVEEQKTDVNLGGGRYKHPMINNARSGYIDCELIAELLVRNGAKVNARDEAGRMPIHYSVLRGTWFMQTLLDLGSDVEATDKLGRGILHYVASVGSFSHLTMLKDAGESRVHWDVPDCDGWTPLLWVCRGGTYDFDEICDSLLEAGASPWARGKGFYDEWSPLKTARYFDIRSPISTDPAMLRRLVPEEKQREAEDGSIERWDDDFHVTKTGWIGETSTCSGCFCTCRGIRWHCAEEMECPNFVLCFVCYMHKDIFHPEENHDFIKIGEKYEPEEHSHSPYESTRSDDSVSSDASHESGSAAGEAELPARHEDDGSRDESDGVSASDSGFDDDESLG